MESARWIVAADDLKRLIDDFKEVAAQLQANPADTPLTIYRDSAGELVAEWISRGTATKVGPVHTEPIAE